MRRRRRRKKRRGKRKRMKREELKIPLTQMTQMIRMNGTPQLLFESLQKHWYF